MTYCKSDKDDKEKSKYICKKCGRCASKKKKICHPKKLKHDH